MYDVLEVQNRNIGGDIEEEDKAKEPFVGATASIKRIKDTSPTYLSSTGTQTSPSKINGVEISYVYLKVKVNL